MPISTKISIEIAGEALTRFSQLVIEQKVQAHHKFSLLQPLPKEFVSQAIDKAQNYMGQPIKITIDPSTMATDSPLVFNGIITENPNGQNCRSFGRNYHQWLQPDHFIRGNSQYKILQ